MFADGGAATPVAGARPRYTAPVCVIPGTAAVAGITRVDEPVGELLDRFRGCRGAGSAGHRAAPPSRVASRLHVRADVGGPLGIVLDSPDVLWAKPDRGQPGPPAGSAG